MSLSTFIDNYKPLIALFGTGGGGAIFLYWIGKFTYKLLFRNKKSLSQMQSSGNDSVNIQVGKNFNINAKQRKNE